MSAVVELDAQRVLRAIHAYASRGWHLFPLHSVRGGACSCSEGASCGNPGKHPRVATGFRAATNDRAQLTAWHQRWPECNWGLACGASGVVVVDIDPRNGGDDSLADLERAHGKLPSTTTALTGGGGQHYMFSADGHTVPSRVLAPGVDLKADGGYVVLPPGTHASGGTYRWDAGGHPNDVAPAPVPAWVRELAGERKHQPQTGPSGAVTAGFIGACFEAMGWLGRSLGADKAVARCPNEDNHTTGSRWDSSTVVFGPRAGATLGHFYCSHSHCSTLKILDEIPRDVQAAVRAARFAPDYNPAEERTHDSPATAIADSDGEWTRQLRYADNGRLTRDPGNAALLLANLPEWTGCLQYDVFADRSVWARPVPPLPGIVAPVVGEELAEHHTTYVHHWLAKNHGVGFSRETVHDAINASARANETHPVREYLAGLRWDGIPRVDTWLAHYARAVPVPYLSAVSRWWLLSAVARVLEPGVQADHIIVLEGPQGAGKSTAAKILGGEWYLGSLPDISQKDAAALLQGSWIVEIGELDAFRGAAATRVKNWVTTRVDAYRPAYGRFMVRRPRQCVFVGTTNELHYIDDSTGGRRFWPVPITGLRRAELEHDRDQLWAEAVHAFHSGETWHPTGDATGHLAVAQEQRHDADVWEARVAAWVEGRPPFTTAEVLGLCLDIEPGRWDRRTQTRVGICLTRLGYRSEQRIENSVRVRRYVRES